MSVSVIFFVFIGPRSDHSLPMSVTHSLTNDVLKIEWNDLSMQNMQNMQSKQSMQRMQSMQNMQNMKIMQKMQNIQTM